MTLPRYGATLAAGLLAAVVMAGACSPTADERTEAATPSSTTTSTPVAAGAPSEGPSTTTAETTMADRFASVTTEAPPPSVALEVRLGGTVTATAAGDVAARCLRGPGFLDVDVVADPPLDAGQYGVTSLVFSAPGYRGPGRYDAARADDEEWTIALVDLETEEPLEFYAPSAGVRGSVTVDAGGASGSFDIGGLVDDEERGLTIAGRFACGVIEG